MTNPRRLKIGGLNSSKAKTKTKTQKCTASTVSNKFFYGSKILALTAPSTSISRYHILIVSNLLGVIVSLVGRLPTKKGKHLVSLFGYLPDPQSNHMPQQHAGDPPFVKFGKFQHTSRGRPDASRRWKWSPEPHQAGWPPQSQSRCLATGSTYFFAHYHF